MKKSHKFLLDKELDNLVVNAAKYPENTKQNAEKWVYVSDLLEEYSGESEEDSGKRLFAVSLIYSHNKNIQNIVITGVEGINEQEALGKAMERVQEDSLADNNKALVLHTITEQLKSN